MISRVAFKAFLQQYELFSERTFKDSGDFFTFYKKDIIELITKVLETFGPIKVQFCLSVSFAKEAFGTEIYSIGYFCSKNFIVNNISKIENNFTKLIAFMDNSIQEFTNRGSGYYINDVDRLDVRIGQYNPMRGSCHMRLPQELFAKKAIVNIKNSDKQCFLWSVIAAIMKIKVHPERVKQYEKFVKHINMKNLKFPMKLEDVPKFESNNNHLNIAINVFTWNKLDDNVPTHLKPIHTSKILNAKHDINLLLFGDHYFYIKNLNRLIFTFGSNNHHFCVNCYQQFATKQRLIDHKERCLEFKPSIARFPLIPYVWFKDIEKMMKFPFVCYVDFESILSDYIEKRGKTKILNKHICCGYSLIVIRGEKDIFFHDFYRGINAIQHFLKNLKNVLNKINNEIDFNVKMDPLTHEQQEEFNNSTECYLCKRKYSLKPDQSGFHHVKVREHCHITGKYNGSSCNECNILYRIPKTLPIFAHNLKGYDSHLIISQLNEKHFEKCEIIPVNIEKFIAFKLDSIQFLDSFNFLASSLDKLVENLRKSDYDFPITKKLYNEKFGYSKELNHLLLRKGIYMYEYMNSFERFNETNLPPKENFFSSLNQTNITDEDYEHAKIVWKKFNISNLGEYHDMYVNLDSSLLADVFQTFRKTIHDTYGLDAAHFISIPGLAWSAALKETKIKLKLFENTEDYQFFERGIRGGMCGVNKRYCSSNDPKMMNYNPEKPIKSMVYLDFNNLYGWAMNQKLPIGEFKWLDEKEYIDINWYEVNTETDIGYVLEVDLHYPDHLHDEHKDFPLCPHKCKISNDSLSPYQKKTIEHLKQFGYRRTVTEKLMLTFYDKNNYIIHFKNLKLYLSLGLELREIHRVIQFKQKRFLKKYIEKNTKLRQNSKNDFERDLFKLMNNSVFGKSIQDQRKHVNIKLALTEKQASKYLSKPNFEQFLILDKDKALIKMRKTVVDLNKPLYVGFTVLELSKFLMFDRHYNYFKRYYGNSLNLAYFDTDSYLYEIETDNMIEELGTVFKDLMDFSNFDKDNEFFDKSKAKVIGYLKSEYGNQPIKEFVGLKSKLYSILYGENSTKHTAKGLQKAILNKFVNHNHYIDVIRKNNVFVSTMRRIQSKEHQLQTIRLKKMIFTPMDDKKFIKKDGINTIPFGHHLTK